MTPHLPSMSDQEMNVACAEELGWMKFGKGQSLISGEWEWLFAHEDSDAPCFAPNFTTSADACLLLIEHIRKHGFSWSCSIYIQMYESRFTNGDRSYLVHADTLPMSITRAFLLATGRAQN